MYKNKRVLPALSHLQAAMHDVVSSLFTQSQASADLPSYANYLPGLIGTANTSV